MFKRRCFLCALQDLVRLEEDQSRELAELQTRHKHLTWKMESLR